MPAKQTTAAPARADALDTLDNPYWEHLLRDTWPGPVVRPAYIMHSTREKLLAAAALPDNSWDGRDHERWLLQQGMRVPLSQRYAWTITDPDTVAFVAAHADPKVIDPLAGNGYWPFLLGQFGIDVYASDCDPSSTGDNCWAHGPEYVPVHRAEAVDAVLAHGDDRALMIAWPPMGDTVGTDAIAAYTGNTIIYLGQWRGGCTGDDTLFDALTSPTWIPVAEHTPVRWDGFSDRVTVFLRTASLGPETVKAYTRVVEAMAAARFGDEDGE